MPEVACDRSRYDRDGEPRDSPAATRPHPQNAATGRDLSIRAAEQKLFQHISYNAQHRLLIMAFRFSDVLLIRRTSFNFGACTLPFQIATFSRN
jgi:hypothetical protein